MNTPWGESQTIEQTAPGIRFISTSSHGGYHLDEEPMAKLRELIPSAKSWAGFPWFEEDCDWAQVVLAFPNHFDDHTVYCAVEMAKGEYLKIPSSYFMTGEGATCTLRAELFHRTVAAKKWRRGSMGTSGKGWSVHFTRGDASKWVEMADYPTQSYYTDEELEAVTLREKKAA